MSENEKNLSEEMRVDQRVIYIFVLGEIESEC